MKNLSILAKNYWKIAIDFSRTALFHMKTRVVSKIFWMIVAILRVQVKDSRYVVETAKLVSLVLSVSDSIEHKSHCQSVSETIF